MHSTTMADNADISECATTPTDSQTQPQEASKAVLWIGRIRRVLLVIGVLYAVAVLLLFIPFFQRQ